MAGTIDFDKAVKLVAQYLVANVDQYADRELGAHNQAKRILWPLLDITEQSRRVLRGGKVTPDPQCTGPGYAHKPHGNCMGYGTDRT